MIVANLIGGPCVGKSSLAADVFARLKREQVVTELVTEYAKKKVWEGSAEAALADQLYVFAKQRHKQWILDGQVDVAVTDSPLLLSLYYGDDKSETFLKLVMEEFQRYDNFTWFIERSVPYREEGRYHSFEEAKEVDKSLKDLLIRNDVDFQSIPHHEMTAELITEQIIEAI